MSSVCRICLFKTGPDNCTNVFSRANTGQLIAEILINFASVQVEENDGLPNVVCSNCEEKLNFVIDFRTLILNSDYELRIEKKHEKDEFLIPDPLLIPKQELNGADLEEENIHKEVKKKRDRKRHLKLFPCTECEKAFRYKHELLEHSSIHTGNVPFICDICNKGFINRSLFNKHKLVHSESRPFACNDCGKTYKHQSGLFLHNKGHHSQSVFQCETCEKAFKQRSMLKEHRRVHTGEKPYVCEFCSKEFSFSSTFGHHLKRHAHKKEPAVPCLTCGKMYSRDKLKQHLKTHSGEKPVSCGICSKKFSVNTSLRVHMRIHEGVKPYSCKICEKSFTQSSILMRHMRVHSGETPYHCSFCEKRFSYSHHLLKHVNREHPNEDSNAKIKKKNGIDVTQK